MIQIEEKVFFFSDSKIYNLTGKYTMREVTEIDQDNLTIVSSYTHDNRLYVAHDSGLIEYDHYDKQWTVRGYGDLNQSLDPGEQIIHAIMREINTIKKIDYSNPDSIDNSLEAILAATRLTISDNTTLDAKITLVQSLIEGRSSTVNATMDSKSVLKSGTIFATSRSASLTLNRFTAHIAKLGKMDNAGVYVRTTDILNKSLKLVKPSPSRTQFTGHVRLEGMPADDYHVAILAGIVPVGESGLGTGQTDHMKRAGELGSNTLFELVISTPNTSFKGVVSRNDIFADNLVTVEGGVLNIMLVDIVAPPHLLCVHYEPEVPGTVLPLTYSITPLANGDVVAPVSKNESLTVQLPDTSSNAVHCVAALNGNGSFHGSIGADNIIIDGDPQNIGIMGIYKAAINGNAVTDMLLPRRKIGKMSNLFVTTKGVVEGGSLDTDGSHIIRDGFGKDSNLDIYNLISTVYGVDKNSTYRCYGTIIINGVTVPVTGFKMSANNACVLFYISQYFKVPEALKNYVGISVGSGLRIPAIVFSSSMLRPTNGVMGMVGDGPGKWGDNGFVMGGDVDNTLLRGTTHSMNYEVSLIDIMIQFNDDCIDTVNLKPGDLFRYTGDYNRYRSDYNKGNFDTFLFPDNDREVFNATSPYPGLPIQPKIMNDNDDDFPFVWNDDENDFISFNGN